MRRCGFAYGRVLCVAGGVVMAALGEATAQETAEAPPETAELTEAAYAAPYNGTYRIYPVQPAAVPPPRHRQRWSRAYDGQRATVPPPGYAQPWRYRAVRYAPSDPRFAEDYRSRWSGYWPTDTRQAYAYRAPYPWSRPQTYARGYPRRFAVD